MEEVWKDINLASLNDQNSSRRTSRSTFGGVILQDFLARPFGIDTPNSMVSSSSVASENSASSSLYCPASPAPPLVTALSLSSRPDHHHFHFDPKGSVPNTSSHLVQQPHHTAPSKVSCFTNPTALFESLASSPCFGNK
ncbi:protein FD-like, partial [Sesbania bispinosa]